MSYLINSNKVMKINEENETLKTVLNDYIKYMMDFDCFNTETTGNGSGFMKVKTHIDDESFNYNEELENKLLKAFEESNDGSSIVEMATTYCESCVNCYGNIKAVKLNISDVSDKTEWFTAMVPKLQVTVSKDTPFEIEKSLGEELAGELLDDFEPQDEIEENGSTKYIYHMENWCNFDKISLFEFRELVSIAMEIAKNAGCALSIVEEGNKFITDDCSSYLEFKTTNGLLNFDVYKIAE